MPIKAPEIGLVISYRYLWSHEADEGREQGQKDRPCAIVLTRHLEGGETIVSVVPVTRRPPQDQTVAIQLPQKVKAHLGLDAEASWVVVNEVNTFVWPGPDLVPIGRDTPHTYSYGFLPPRLLTRIRNAVLECAGKGKLNFRTRP